MIMVKWGIVMDYIAFGKRVCRLRREKRLSWKQLAEQAGMSAAFLGRIERGSREVNLDTLMRLCRALNVTPNTLLSDMLPEQRGQMPEYVTISPTALLEGVAELLQKQEIPQ